MYPCAWCTKDIVRQNGTELLLGCVRLYHLLRLEGLQSLATNHGLDYAARMFRRKELTEICLTASLFSYSRDTPCLVISKEQQSAKTNFDGRKKLGTSCQSIYWQDSSANLQSFIHCRVFNKSIQKAVKWSFFVEFIMDFLVSKTSGL